MIAASAATSPANSTVRALPLPVVRRQNQRSRRRKGAAGAVHHAGGGFRLLAFDAVHAVFGGAGELAVGLHQELHPVHAGMVERQAAAVGVDGQASAGSGIAVLPQRIALAAGGKAQHFRGDGGGDRERVVDHRHFHVPGPETSHLVGGGGRAACRGGGEVLHLQHVLMSHGLAGAGNPDRSRAQAVGDLRAGDDHRAAVVGDDAAVIERQRPGDQARLEHVLHGDGAAERALLLAEHHAAWIELCPVAGDHGNVGEILGGGAEVVEVAHHGVGVLRRGAEDAIGAGHLAAGADLAPTAATAASAAIGPSGLAVADEGDVDDAGMDRRQCVVNVDLERAAAHRGGVEIARVQAQMLRQFARPAGGEDALDVGDGNAGHVRDVLDRLDVMLQGGDLLAGEFLRIADHVGFGGADDGRRIAEVHRRHPIPPPRARTGCWCPRWPARTPPSPARRS